MVNECVTDVIALVAVDKHTVEAAALGACGGPRLTAGSARTGDAGIAGSTIGDRVVSEKSN